jgi:hypothetical protein
VTWIQTKDANVGANEMCNVAVQGYSDEDSRLLCGAAGVGYSAT